MVSRREFNLIVNRLQPGDLMAYKPSGFFGWLIRIKTWHSVSHVETYVGNEWSIASRDGKGVDKYPVRMEGLYGIYRPIAMLDLSKGLEWFERRARGQCYDWKGILGFTTIVPGGDRTKMFCSEFCTRLYRAMGVEPFQKGEDADKIAPF